MVELSFTRKYIERDISEYLSNFKEFSSSVSYQLTLEGKKGQRTIGDDVLYQDGKYGIALRSLDAQNGFEGTKVVGGRIALISFDKIKRKGILCLQIQSSHHLAEFLPKQWERSLLRSTCKWASDEGYKRVVVQSAENNDRFTYPPGIQDLDAWQSRLKIRYNITPMRLGFERNSDSNFELLI